MFVIHRNASDGGGYVARPGNHNSYVHNILLARKYPTREAAEADLCIENEYVEDVRRILEL